MYVPAHRLKLYYINLTSSPLPFPTSKLLQTSILYFILITSAEIARYKETMKVKNQYFATARNAANRVCSSSLLSLS